MSPGLPFAAYSMTPALSPEAYTFLALLRNTGPGPAMPQEPPARNWLEAYRLTRCARLRGGRADRLAVPPVPGAAVSRPRASARTPGPQLQALQPLGLLAAAAPGEVLAAFRAALRGRGLAEPGDPAAAPAAVRSWSRPDIYGLTFSVYVPPGLRGAERAQALQALHVLADGPGGRSRERPGARSGQTGDGPGGGSEVFGDE